MASLFLSFEEPRVAKTSHAKPLLTLARECDNVQATER